MEDERSSTSSGSSGQNRREIEGMESLIPTINAVHDLLVQTNGHHDPANEIEFPQIATVGSQSSGKGSVLETLVGHSFLPRGAGITTRCPIILRLVTTPGTSIWCELEHRPNVMFQDFCQVEQEIRARTDELCGTTGGVSNDSIKVTFYSPNVLNLTVVDLPGITEIPMTGQPPDMPEKIRELVRSYISQENCIILAVCAGNDDIANSKSIRFAKEVDPQRKRTIAVVTKIDLVREREDMERMSEILKGNLVPIILGIVGVINRKQSDIDGNTPLSEVLEYEETFFQDNYPDIAHLHGIRYLARKLNNILSRHIADSCKDLVVTVRKLAEASQTELRSLGNDAELSDNEKRRIMVNEIDKFTGKYKTQVDGQQRGDIVSGILTRGTRLNYTLVDRLNAELKSLEMFANMSDEKILIAIRNAMPVGARMIITEVALNHFVQEEIKKISPVSIRIANLAFQEMTGMIKVCLTENKRFPNLNKAISSVVKELLTEKMEITKEVLETYFEVQSSSSLTANPAFSEIFKRSMAPISVVDLGVLPARFVNLSIQGESYDSAFESESSASSSSSSSIPEGDVPMPERSDFSEQQLKLCAEMKNLAGVLFEIVRWQAQDYIAKGILSALVYKTVDNVGSTLNMELNTFEKIESLVREPEDIKVRRLSLRQKLQEYKQALQLLDGIMNIEF